MIQNVLQYTNGQIVHEQTNHKHTDILQEETLPETKTSLSDFNQSADFQETISSLPPQPTGTDSLSSLDNWRT